MTESVSLESHDPNLRVDRVGDVVTVTLDRPDARNACTGDMWVALGAVFRSLGSSGARAVVLTGAGGNFCAGADLGGSSGDGAGSGAPMATMNDAMRVLSDVVLSIHACPVPVVAAVDGICVGAGLGLALAADLTYCSDRARLSVIYARRGLSLDFGTSWLLRQRLGAHRAKELAFTARMVDGPEAAELGLVNHCVPAEMLEQTVAEVVDTIASGPPIALASTKRMLDQASTGTLAEALELEALAQSVNVTTADMREALTAYLERRPPRFTGR